MKGASSYFELMIIVVFMAASIAILSTLLYTLNKSNYSYIDDKTTLSMKEGIEYEQVYVDGKYIIIPVYLGGYKLSYPDILLTFLVFDEYAPESNRISVENTLPVDFTDKNNVVYKYDYFNNWYNLSAVDSPNLSAYINDTSDWYAYWNNEEQRWNLTRTFVMTY